MKNIKYISFFVDKKNQNDEIDERIMDAWKRKGHELKDMAETIQFTGQKVLKHQLTLAHNIALEAEGIVNDFTLTENQLLEAQTDIHLKIKHLNDIINNSLLDFDPDSACFVAVLKVTCEDESQFTINEGINEK